MIYSKMPICTNNLYPKNRQWARFHLDWISPLVCKVVSLAASTRLQIIFFKIFSDKRKGSGVRILGNGTVMWQNLQI